MSNPKLHVKKGDNVYVLTGKNRGRRGKILKVFPSTSRVLVEGVNIIVKHKKPQRTNPGGIIRQEAAIHSSNVMLICEKCRTPTKVGKRVLENGEKVRICKKCDEIMDTVSTAD
ncbi:MAG: 50S ribosomal protein L24 [Oscillospiraceae bacterium]|nr:50S ribosomal protein L24 [Oscillospiraceae bacterium]